MVFKSILRYGIELVFLYELSFSYLETSQVMILGGKPLVSGVSPYSQWLIPHPRFLNMSWAIMNTWGMAVDQKMRKLYMADYEKSGELTGKSTDFDGRIIRTNLDGSDAEVTCQPPSRILPCLGIKSCMASTHCFGSRFTLHKSADREPRHKIKQLPRHVACGSQVSVLMLAVAGVALLKQTSCGV